MKSFWSLIDLYQINDRLEEIVERLKSIQAEMDGLSWQIGEVNGWLDLLQKDVAEGEKELKND